jgi:hypothetical protein
MISSKASMGQKVWSASVEHMWNTSADDPTPPLTIWRRTCMAIWKHFEKMMRLAENAGEATDPIFVWLSSIKSSKRSTATIACAIPSKAARLTSEIAASSNSGCSNPAVHVETESQISARFDEEIQNTLLKAEAKESEAKNLRARILVLEREKAEELVKVKAHNEFESCKFLFPDKKCIPKISHKKSIWLEVFHEKKGCAL